MKMNVSMSMDFFKPVKQFFKKYTALLPSIGITLAALLIFPVMLMVGGSVNKEMKTSVDLTGKVSSLLRDVPSRETPGRVKLYMDHLEEEAAQIEKMAVETSMRELISYDVFPPKGTSSQLYVAFGKKYRAAVEQMITQMNALDAPSDAEISRQTGAETRTPAGGMEMRRSVRNVETGPMVDALCLKRAQEISVYAHPSAFPWYNFWETYEFAGQQQALKDCWDSQVVYWICKDIVDTISAMNEGSEKISSSPVKRLMAVSFTGPIMSGSRPSREMYQTNTAGLRETPNYIIQSSAAGMAGTLSPGLSAGASPGALSYFVTDSLTKRVSDEDVDVIHFAFSVLVDNRYVMAFMQELCSEKQHTYREGFKEAGEQQSGIHNQITILDSRISAVDKADPDHELYRYGNGAVMRLDMVCEYQFYRKGYDGIKPQAVKQALGQSETDGQTPTEPTAPSRQIFDRGGRSPL